MSEGRITDEEKFELTVYRDEMCRQGYHAEGFYPDSDPEKFSRFLGELACNLGKGPAFRVKVTHTDHIDFGEFGMPLDGPGHIVYSTRETEGARFVQPLLDSGPFQL